MIGRLTGQIVGKTGNQILLDVHDVGYQVNCHKRDWQQLEINQTATLYVHTNVKEDALDLYGFVHQMDLQTFKLLITVSGVGPKLALTVLGAHTASGVGEAISKADTQFFQEISGIGKKNAQKIIVELKSKFAQLKDLELQDELQPFEEITAVMQALGYKTAEIKPWLAKLPAELTQIEDQIRWLLKEIRQK